MSYTKRYSEVLSKSVTINYPPSQDPGSKTVSVEIPVDIYINVDTEPFENSVENCNSNVDLLTAAVVTTQSAELASKRRNSIKVAESIIGGFFGYIRSEISQQVSELTQNADAQLMHLRELMQSCILKKKQLETDYTRISSRYAKIFDDLNNELSSRIHELDKAAFVFDKQTKDQKSRLTDNDMVNTVSVFGMESGNLQSKVSASIAKKRALDTVNKVKVFLWQQNKLNCTIQHSMLNDNKTGSIYVPICYFETKNVSNQIERDVYKSSYLSAFNDPALQREFIEHFSSNALRWDKISEKDDKNLSMLLNTILNDKVSANDKHSLRVRQLILKLADISSINSNRFQ